MANSRWLARGRGYRALTGCVAMAGAAMLRWAGTAGPAAAAASTPRTPFGDHPAGFWYGTDSLPISISGPQPYKEPVIGGDYGGYIGMTGKWSTWLGCHVSRLAWSSANSRDANANFARSTRPDALSPGSPCCPGLE